LRSEIGEAAWNELNTDQRAIHALNESTMGGYSLAMDVYGDPGMVLRVSVLRDVHAQGVVALNNLGILLAIASVGFGVVVFLLIERTVVSRLSGLKQEVSRLDPNSAGDMRVGSHGEDEIGELGISINELLATIDTAQKDLIASEKRYRLLVNSAAEAIVVIQDGTVRLVNPMAVSMIGSSEAELLSKPFPETIHPEDRAFVVENHKKRLRGEAVPDRYHFRLLTKDGGFKWVEISAVAIEWEGRPATLNFITDVTERKRAEDALRLANTKMGIMTTVARHDIGNQMMVVRGFIELSKLKVEDPDLTKYLNKMSEATVNVQEQIAFTKDYQELGIRAPAWAAVGAGIVESYNLLRPIGLKVEDKTRGLEIMADPLVERVFYNLVDNSIRHGDGVKCIRISAEPRGNAMLVIYEDDGVGIKDEDRAHIFEKGFGKNSGYGLFLIREILAITGITIEERGKAGKGVRFEMTVPADAWRMKQQ
ncbi:MAG: PAS domain S-box protein, partial [Methanomassiliicoccales archaeon]|nr:PAS domain S-box protein [Methanomassiliicoccales archaeon]